MSEFIFDNYEWMICFFLSLVSAIVVYFRTRSLGKSSKKFIEEIEMFKSVYKQQEEKSQSFTEEIKDYVLNPQTNELEEVELPKNVQTAIQSYIDSALERALERYLYDQDSAEEDPEEMYVQAVRDLSVLGEAMESAEYYRERYGLDGFASLADIYAKVDEEAQSCKKKINQIEEKKSEISSQASSETQKQT